MQESLNKSFQQGYLQVSALHELWYAEYGNPEGVPVIVLHGGPGAGCSEKDITFLIWNFGVLFY